MRRRVWLLLPVLVGGAAYAQAANEFIGAFPVETSLTGPITWRTTRLRFTASDAKVWTSAFLTRRGAVPVDGGVEVVDLSATAPVRDPVLPRHRAATWVMDFDEKAFEPAWLEAKAALGEKPTVAAVTGFVASALTKKSYEHGFDLASNVAKTRGGDCTEHAVFLAALLRRFGIPARGMMGIALVPRAGPPGAFGHMWVEAWVDGAWQVTDAALPRELNVAYLPTGELTDEGPGFGQAVIPLARAMSLQHIQLSSTVAKAP